MFIKIPIGRTGYPNNLLGALATQHYRKNIIKQMIRGPDHKPIPFLTISIQKLISFKFLPSTISSSLKSPSLPPQISFPLPSNFLSSPLKSPSLSPQIPSLSPKFPPLPYI